MIRIFLFAISMASLLLAGAGAADDRDDLQILRAQRVAEAGDCEVAIGVLGALSDTSARAAFLRGKCEIRLARYEAAADSLERARSLDSRERGVNLQLGIAHYHLEQFGRARESFDRARPVGRDVAVFDFYTGLLLLREEEPRSAALAFERAGRAGPDLVEPVASYYAALAWQNLEEGAELEAALARVLEHEPEGPWAEEARRLLEDEKARQRQLSGLSRWASVRAGMEYDTNVILRGAGVTLPENVSDEKDWRGVWGGTAGAELFRSENWSGGAALAYTGTAHTDLSDFDVQYPAATLWIDRALGERASARLRADSGYAWVDNKPYVFGNSLTGELFYDWQRLGLTTCSLGGGYNNFMYSIKAFIDPDLGFGRSDLDQDGGRLRGGCSHEYGFSVADAAVWAGYHPSRTWSDGREYDHWAQEVELGGRIELLLAIRLEVIGRYVRRDYDKASIFAQPTGGLGSDHEDDQLSIEVVAEREFFGRYVVSGRYRYIDNDSNTKAYDYDRHIVGAYVEVRFY